MSHHKAYVRDWMTPNPVTVAADASLLKAYDVMHQHQIRRLPVVDAQEQLCGIITRSDIYQFMPFFRGELDHTDVVFALAGQTVEDVMTAQPITVTPDDPVRQVAQHMIMRKISGVPVVSDGRVVGMITESDIFRLVVESWAEEDEAADQ